MIGYTLYYMLVTSLEICIKIVFLGIVGIQTVLFNGGQSLPCKGLVFWDSIGKSLGQVDLWTYDISETWQIRLLATLTIVVG